MYIVTAFMEASFQSYVYVFDTYNDAKDWYYTLVNDRRYSDVRLAEVIDLT